MRISPLGAAGIQRRIQEIEQKMSDLFGTALANASGMPNGLIGAGTGMENFTSGSLQSSIDTSLPLVWDDPISSSSPLQPLDMIPSNAGVRLPEIEELLRTAANEAGVDEALLRAIVNAESAWNPNATSPDGRQGLTGLSGDLARSIGVADPFDPKASLTGGAKYIKQLLDRFGSTELAVAAYRSGPGAVARHKGVPPFADTKAYVDRVLGEAKR